MRWIVSGLVFALAACGGGKAPLGASRGGPDSGTDSGFDGGYFPDAGTDAGVDAGPTTDAGSDAGDSGDAGFDAGDGQGKCYYSITPAYWNWDWSFEGVTFPIEDGGFFLDLFIINSLGPNECLVTYPTLTPETNAAFSLLMPPGPLWLPAPGNDAGLSSSLMISLWFAPPGPGVYTGGLMFDVTDPSAPHQTLSFWVAVDALFGPSCFLIRPSFLDFGQVTRGPCPGAHELSFMAINACAQPVTIQSMTVAEGAPFSLVGDQVPQTVAQGGTTSFTVDSLGGEDGIIADTLRVQTDLQYAPFGVTLAAFVGPGTAQTDTFSFEGNYLFLLSGTPDRDGPTLTVNGTAFRDGVDWSYDPLTNILAIDSTRLTLSLGDQIEISYHLACS